MSDFIVSARKYRPSTFESVIGQEHVTQTLKNAIATDQLSQAFLFCGPRGVGKTTCARILAKTVNCLERNEQNEACNQCASCLAFIKNTSYNIIELDAASNNSVEDIRALIQQVRYPPHAGNKKIYIIDEVHMLSNQAFNAFLKTLEEPPVYAIFVLATTEKYKIIPTILSRCQIFDFRRMTLKQITQQLTYIAQKEKIRIGSESLHLIAQKSEGAMRDALSLFDMVTNFSPNKIIDHSIVCENLHIIDYDNYFLITDYLSEKNFSQVLLNYYEILKKGFDESYFITGLTEHFRNLLVAKDIKTVPLLDFSEEAIEKYAKQAKKIDASFLFRAIDIAHKASIEFKQAKNKRLHIEIALMKICHFDYNSSLSPKELDNKKHSETPKSTVKKIKSTPKISSYIGPLKKKDINMSLDLNTPQEKLNFFKKEYPIFIDFINNFDLAL